MSKVWRTILIITAVIALLAGALVFLLASEEPSDSDTDNTDDTAEDISLIHIETEKDSAASPVRSAAISSKGFESFTVERTDTGTLVIPAYADLAPQTSLFEALETMLTDISAVKIVSETGDAAAYGFDKPQATFAVTYESGKSYSFEFGNEEPYGTGDYFRFAESNTVYLVDTELLDSVALNPKAYISTSLYSSPVLPEAKTNQTVKAVLRDIDFSGSFYGKTPFAFRMIGNNDIAEYQYSNYLITKPFVRNSNSDILGDDILAAAELTADLAVVPRYTSKDLKAYGLSDPYVVATLHTAAYIQETIEEDGASTSSVSFKNVEEHTVTLSKPDENGKHYVIVDDNPTIFEITGETVAWLGLTYEETLSPLLFLKEIASVESITLTLDGETTAFKLTHYPNKEDADEKLTVTANEQTISTAQFRGFYQVLMSLSRTGAASKTPSGKPDVRVQVKTADGMLDIKLYAESASVYLVENQGEVYKITASQVRNLKTQLNNLLSGNEVKT